MPNWLRFHSYQGPLLLVTDCAALYVAVGVMYYWRLGEWVPVNVFLISVLVVTLVVLYVMNVYHFAPRGSETSHAVRTFMGVAISGVLLASSIYITKSTDAAAIFWRGNLAVSMLIFATWAALFRYTGSIVKRRVGKKPLWLAIGNDLSTSNLKKDYASSGLEGYIKAISSESRPLDEIWIELDDGLCVIKDSDDTVLHRGAVSGIVLTSINEIPEKLSAQLMHLRLRGIPVLELSDFYEQTLLRVPVMELKDRWFVLSTGFNLLHREVAMKIKRLLDTVMAVVGLVILLPVMLLIAVLVRTTSKGPALYRQVRCGVNDNEYVVYKFRTMFKNAEASGAQWSQPGDDRITPVGRVLRKSRMDELPQLWNVLIGDMSFIGPRPERPDFVNRLIEEIPYYELRHLVKPGITGWAQVMYPYGSSVEDAKNKLEFDLYYIKNYSLALDVYILLRTIRVVFSRAGR